MQPAPNVARLGALLLATLALPLRAADVGVLTPATGKLRILAYTEPNSSLLTLGIPESAVASRGGELNQWAKRDGYDLSAQLTQKLLVSFDRAGHTATAIAIARKPAESARPIAPDQLPAAPAANRLLDVTLQYSGLYAKSSFSSFEPAFAAEYRWLSPAGDLIQGTRLVIYNRDFGVNYRGNLDHDSLTPFVKPFKSVDIEANPDCKFRTSHTVQENTARLWPCFDEALARIADEIARDMPASNRPRNGMTSERDDN